ncbi:MAG: hypothetical protein KC503_29965 [Myxococcales bacterium]|nr:hypothetical protein [Myxococcales bacterium]
MRPPALILLSLFVTTPAAARSRELLRHLDGVAVVVSSLVDNRRISTRELVDGDLSTAWNSRTGKLVGEWVGFWLPAGARVEQIKLTIGDVRRKGIRDLFVLNHRIHKVRLWRGRTKLSEHTLDLSSRALQSIAVRDGRGGALFRVEIITVEPGKKRRWREICVSELQAWGSAPKLHPKAHTPLAIVGAATTRFDALCPRGTQSVIGASGQDCRDTTGKRQGPARYYTTRGILRFSGSFRDDKRSGTWLLYDARGKLAARVPYRAGKKHGVSTRYERGLVGHARFEAGKPASLKAPGWIAAWMATQRKAGAKVALDFAIEAGQRRVYGLHTWRKSSQSPNHETHRYVLATAKRFQKVLDESALDTTDNESTWRALRTSRYDAPTIVVSHGAGNSRFGPAREVAVALPCLKKLHTTTVQVNHDHGSHGSSDTDCALVTRWKSKRQIVSARCVDSQSTGDREKRTTRFDDGSPVLRRGACR